MNSIPGFPAGVQPLDLPFVYAPLPAAAPEPYVGPDCTAQPGFNLLPCDDD